MGKVITVNVYCMDGVTCVTDSHFFHKDSGCKLSITGLNLETGTQVHFSLTEKSGNPVSMIGVSENGIFSVDVPDNVLNNNTKRNDYDIYAFVYCTDEYSGWTEHEIIIPVKMRPDKEYENPTSEELTAFDKVARYVSETAESIADDREQINKNKESIEELKKNNGNVNWDDLGGTVEITSEKPKKKNTVLTIDPNAEEISMYSAEEIDELIEELRENGVSSEDIVNAVKKYLEENPIEIDVPKKLSDLNDDADHRTVTDKEKQTWNGKLDASKLTEAVNEALAQAKASGEFNGKDGMNGKDGADGKTPEKGVDYFSEADKTSFVQDVLNALPTWQGGVY